jgi:hypothetical protein
MFFYLSLRFKNQDYPFNFIDRAGGINFKKNGGFTVEQERNGEKRFFEVFGNGVGGAHVFEFE